MEFLNPDQYQPVLTKLYEQLSESLKECLPHVKVEHIGSSSIAGAISKGDLDVYVEVPKEQFTPSLNEIISLGFTIKEDTLRTDSLCMLTTSIFNMDVAIQLVEEGKDDADFVHFRNLLNQNPALVQKYNELKKACVGMTPENYREKKATFIERTLKDAGN